MMMMVIGTIIKQSNHHHHILATINNIPLPLHPTTPRFSMKESYRLLFNENCHIVILLLGSVFFLLMVAHLLPDFLLDVLMLLAQSLSF